MKEKLLAGERAFGVWSMIASPVVANVLATGGADFVIVDLEHGPMNLETVEAELYAIESCGSSPVVRMRNAPDTEILNVLEIGTRSLMMSHVSSAEEAARIAAACRYPPEGTRGLSPFTRVHGYSEQRLPEKLADANREMLTGVLVEGESGIREIAGIAATPGVDLVYLGVYDLSMAAGVPGQVDHPDVLDLMRTSVRVIEEAGAVAGSVARDLDYMRLLADAGFRFISYRNDATLLRDAVHQARVAFDRIGDA